MNKKVIHLKSGFRYLLFSFLIIFYNSQVFAQKPDQFNLISINNNSNNKGQKEEFIAGEIIVQFKPEAAKAIKEAVKNLAKVTGLEKFDNLNRKYGVSQIVKAFKFDDSPKVNKKNADEFGLTRTFILKVPGSINIEDAIKEFKAINEVVYAEQNFFAQGDVVPNDPIYSQQWGLNNTGQAVRYSTGVFVGTPGADINAQLAWDLHSGSNSTVLSILDSGVDYNHPDFAGRIVSGYDFINNDNDPMDDLGHGTACAGIAAAAGNNGIGVAGVNWNCMIMPVKVLGSNNSGTWIQIANGITWAADNGADVLSLSIGGGGYSATLENAVNYAHSLGCVILASRGNSNNTALSYPASFANVIAVGALSPCNERKSPTSCDGETWWGSSYGADLEVMAPGTRIHTTDRLGSVGYSTGDYTSTFNGTSAACPFAAGTAALIRSYAPTLTNNEIRDVLQKTAVDIGSPGFDIETGYGRVNAFAALNFAANAVPPDVSLSAASLSFTLDPDQTNNDLFTITNNGGANSFSLLWNLTYNPSSTWLSVNKSSGKLAGGANEQITVSINTTGLIAGNYQCALNINSNDPNDPVLQVTVDLTVNSLPPPVFTISPSAITKTVNTGETVTDLLTIVNSTDPGHLNLHWSAVIQGSVPGISINPASGMAIPGASNSIQVTINASGVSAGNYSGTINITTNDPDKILVQIPVELTVNTSAIGGQKLYVFNSSNPASIIRADLDGQNASQPYLGLGRPVDGAVDMVNRKLYYLDWSPNINIYRVDLEGTNKELLLSFSGSSNAVVDIALDVQNNHMYFAQQVAALTYRISRANLDGSNLVTLADIPSRGISGINIVPTQGKIYWAGNDANLDYTLTGIWRANLDLTNQEQLTTGAVTVRSLALDVSNDKMYWYEARDLGGYNYGRYIRKATMNGQSGLDILSVEAGDVALDPVGAKVYWTEQGGNYPNLTYDTYRANTDGTNTEALGLWGYRLAIDFSPLIVNTSPIAVCKDITIPADDNCVGNAQAIDFDNGSSDNELDPLIFTVIPAGPYPLGTTNVVLKVSDGLLEDQCNATITVVDVTPPVLTAASNQDVHLDGTCSVIIPDVRGTATDNCSGFIITQVPAVGDVVSALHNGTIDVIVTATDGAGLTDVASVTLTAKDVTPPLLTAASNQDVDLDGTCSVIIPDVRGTATDNCLGIVITQVPVVGDVVSTAHNGIIDVIVTATDGAGLTDAKTVTLTAKDVTPPVLTAESNQDVNLDGTCSVIVPDLRGTATDNCLGTIITQVPSVGDVVSTSHNGTIDVLVTATDGAGLTDVKTVILTAKDITPPMIISCAANITSAGDAGVCTKTFTAAQIGNTTASDNCIVQVTWERSDGATNLIDPFVFGTTTITWTATDAAGLTATCNQTINVNMITTTTTVVVTPSTQQYSDLVEFKASITPWNCVAGGNAGGNITFYVGTQAMGASVPIGSDGTVTMLYPLVEIPSQPSNGQMAPGNKTVTAKFNNFNPAFNITNPTTGLTVIKEDAIVEYSGVEFQATPGSNANEAIVELRVVIKSVPDNPNSGGDIRNACIMMEIGGTTIGPLTPQLINPADLTTGVVIHKWTANIGSANYASFDLKVTAGCYFTGEDRTVITVYKPVGDFITGGGNIKPTLSSGQYASTPGLKSNFGFHVKFNKNGTNLQGGMNIIFRKMAGNVVQLFQIKTNSMSSLGLNITDPKKKTAVFTSKANLKNLTTGESLGGNLLLQVKITDRGEPGTNDDIAITLWYGNILLYSSNWTVTSTSPLLLSGGNLVVKSGFGLKSGEITTNINSEIPGSFDFKMYPNPTRGEVTLELTASEIQNLEVIVHSITGNEVFRKKYIASGQITFDLINQVSGIYLVTLKTESTSSVKKLILDRK